MGLVPYPKDFSRRTWVRDYVLPEGFKKNLLEKFLDWPELCKAVEDNDKTATFGYLWLYQKRLATFTPKDIRKATSLESLQERADEALRVARFIHALEKKFFPEDIQARKEQREMALRSWEY